MTSSPIIPLTPPLTGVSVVDFTTASVEVNNASISTVTLFSDATVSKALTISLSIVNAAGVNTISNTIRGNNI